jgi:hypothetical protein
MSTQIDPGHGHSPAAWTAIVIMLIAFSGGTVAYCFDLPWLVVGAAVLLAVGPLVGWILAKAGYGVAGPKYTPKAHH